MTTAVEAIRAVEHFDVRLAKALGPIGDSAVGGAICSVGKAADQPPIRVALATAILGGWLGGEGKLAGTALRALAAHQLATMAKGWVKHRIDRTRPSKMLKDGEYKAEPGDTDHHDFNSFPSGHTAGAFAVAEAFGRTYPEQRWTARSVAAAMAAAQLPRKKHYLSDVIAGALIGIAAERTVAAVWPAR